MATKNKKTISIHSQNSPNRKQKETQTTHQLKSQVFNHLAPLHLSLVHGLPYPNGAKCCQFQIARAIKTAAICNLTLALNVDVIKSNTVQNIRIAK